MKALLALLLALVSTVCLADPPNNAAEELNIREATVRYQFGKTAAYQQQSGKSYYLEIIADGKSADPDDAFMKRFGGNKPPVKKRSECDISTEKGAVNNKTGEDGGLVFTIGPIKWVSDTEAEISVIFYQGILNASGSIYYLKKIDGKWKVIEAVQRWIS